MYVFGICWAGSQFVEQSTVLDHSNRLKPRLILLRNFCPGSQQDLVQHCGLRVGATALCGHSYVCADALTFGFLCELVLTYDNTKAIWNEQAKGWCSKKPICIVGWMMRKRKMDIEHGKKMNMIRHAQTITERHREREIHTHKYMYVICIDRYVLPMYRHISCALARAHTHTHTYLTQLYTCRHA